MTKKAPAGLDVQTIEQKLEEAIAYQTELEDQLEQAKDREQRAIADYQNLVRRTQDERLKLFKLAGREVISDLLEPLSHLTLAAQQINDQGLNMIIKQLWDKLNQNGVEEIDVMGQQFDVETMEASDIQGDENLTVTKVIKPGYRLNGEVIQHAKVALGDQGSSGQQDSPGQ